MNIRDYLQLVNYRQQVFNIYSRVRDPGPAPELRWQRFRSAQDQLFKNHPQTALTAQQQIDFSSLPFFPYNPEYRYILPIKPLNDQTEVWINLQDEGPTLLQPFGQVSFVTAGESACLTLYWIQAYGGGIFLPFKDTTNGHETYSGGRYLLDTIKGADAVILAVRHSEYLNLNPEEVVNMLGNPAAIIDCPHDPDIFLAVTIPHYLDFNEVLRTRFAE